MSFGNIGCCQIYLWTLLLQLSQISSLFAIFTHSINYWYLQLLRLNCCCVETNNYYGNRHCCEFVFGVTFGVREKGETKMGDDRSATKHGRWKGGEQALDFEIISKKRLFVRFRGVKNKFHHFCPPPGKILPTPMQQSVCLSIEMLRVRSTATEIIAVALLGQGRSLPPHRQETKFQTSTCRQLPSLK